MPKPEVADHSSKKKAEGARVSTSAIAQKTKQLTATLGCSQGSTSQSLLPLLKIKMAAKPYFAAYGPQCHMDQQEQHRRTV